MSVIILMFTVAPGSAEVLHKASVTLRFRADSVGIDASYMQNRQALDSIHSIIDFYIGKRRGLELRSVNVAGAASPEGGVWRNDYLSRERAKRIFNYVAQFAPLPDSITSLSSPGRDYEGALRMVNEDPATPRRADVAALLRKLIALKATNPSVKAEDALLRRLVTLDGGVPFAYMLRNHFPELRRSHITMTFAYPADRKMADDVPDGTLSTAASFPALPTTIDGVYIPAVETSHRFVALCSNLLHDLLLIPNIGFEIPLGKDWTLGAQWSYGWWTNMPRQDRYIHLYGGDVTLRKYLAPLPANPLSGHHLGVYGQMYSYDYKFTNIGYWGERWSIGAGFEYGYSLPLARSLSLDFTAGAGYLTGIYNQYDRNDGCDVWMARRRKRWIGPTKLEVSLVWLLDLPGWMQKGGVR